MLAGPSASAEGSALQLFDKIATLKAQGKLPGLGADGITLPQRLLFDKLKESVASPELELKELILTDDKGTIRLVSRSMVDALVTVDFRFREVDWPRRLVWIEYSQATESASDSFLGQLLGSLAIYAFEYATGSEHVKAALSDKPYLTVEKNRIGVKLDQIPSLAGPLAMGVGSFRVFDYVGIRSIKTEPGRIRIALGVSRN